MPPGLTPHSVGRTFSFTCTWPISSTVLLQPAALELLTTLVPVLAKWGRWYLFGAQAVVAYGVPRLSADVDVTLALRKATVKRLPYVIAFEKHEQHLLVLAIAHAKRQPRTGSRARALEQNSGS